MLKKPNRSPSLCHPEKANAGRGMCSACYSRQRERAPSSCHPEKPKHTSDGKCRICYQKDFRKANPPTEEQRLKSREFFQKYHKLPRRKEAIARQADAAFRKKLQGMGTSPEEIDALKRRNPACEICGAIPTGVGTKGLVVDHDHGTGMFRGLLCSPCNAGIGLLRDSEQILRAAVEYLSTRAARKAA